MDDFDAQLERTKLETRLRNETWTRIERLPEWMREVETLFWHLASIDGGT